MENKEIRLSELEKEIGQPGFWNDSNHAQGVMKTASGLRAEVDSWRTHATHLNDLIELARMDDPSLREELEKEIVRVEADLEKRAVAAMLSGPYDHDDAILAIHAGAGGTDSQDWAEMLQRMYLRWAEGNGYSSEIMDTTPGEEAGIKSVTMAISGDHAYGYLRSEKGVHRLVRLSPFDAAHRRHTSFALIEILPQLTMEEAEIDIHPSEMKLDVFRSSGAGGQNVQKNATAVRITHLPTGIVVTCQNERSQTQNREFAMKILRARLLELRRAEREEERAVLRGEYTKAEWGSQIRSYVLHPYQMVKDHRTDYEVGNAQAVLDGDLTGFMEAYLKQAD
ncbi:MAG: peptide chain release factor 2 [Chloroflexi bacterium]|nr:peptide chain release factor 2 [Chloroflexota bacterium]